jgi:hypothetical protein
LERNIAEGANVILLLHKCFVSVVECKLWKILQGKGQNEEKSIANIDLSTQIDKNDLVY